MNNTSEQRNFLKLLKFKTKYLNVWIAATFHEEKFEIPGSSQLLWS